MDHTAARRDRLTRLLPEEGVDAFLISNPVNVTYLTGFTGDSSTVVLTRDRVVLVSDPRYVGQIADECPELETHIRTATTRIAEACVDVLKKLGGRTVGFESSVVTVAEFEYLKELAPAVAWKAADRVEKLRMVKDDDELGRIRDAIAVAQRAFAALIALLRPEDTEIELSNGLEANVRRAGGEGTSFPPIVAVGERAAPPHCPPSGKRVSESGLLHEIAHALVGPGHGHDAVWRRKCVSIGARPKRCGDADMPEGSWRAQCPLCGKRYDRRRRPQRLKGWICPSCGPELGGLAWNVA